MTNSATVSVLLYHSVGVVKRASFAPWTVDCALFDEHLMFLRERGFALIRFRDVPEALEQGRRAVVITLDDALTDAMTDAAPLLRRHKLPATFFVPSGYVGGRADWMRGGEPRLQMLSWEALADLAADGFEIGSHGRMHLSATASAVDEFLRDATTSKFELEQRLGLAVDSFAYPYGHVTPGARRAVRQAGFAQAAAVGQFASQWGDDRYAIPRLDVRASTPTDSLLAMINGRRSIRARGWAFLSLRLPLVARRRRGRGFGSDPAHEVRS